MTFIKSWIGSESCRVDRRWKVESGDGKFPPASYNDRLPVSLCVTFLLRKNISLTLHMQRLIFAFRYTKLVLQRQRRLNCRVSWRKNSESPNLIKSFSWQLSSRKVSVIWLFSKKSGGFSGGLRGPGGLAGQIRNSFIWHLWQVSVSAENRCTGWPHNVFLLLLLLMYYLGHTPQRLRSASTPV